MTNHQLADVLNKLNWHYGRGEIVEVYRAERYVIRRVPVTQSRGFEEKRRFRIDGNTVHFLGHQRTVPYVGRLVS